MAGPFVVGRTHVDRPPAELLSVTRPEAVEVRVRVKRPYVPGSNAGVVRTTVLAGSR
jgi:hypothetical protein